MAHTRIGLVGLSARSSKISTTFLLLSWMIAQVLLSTSQNPTTFEDFNETSVEWFSHSGAGESCIAVDFENLGIEGIKDGSNVTIQIQYNAGDGNLFQVSYTRSRSNPVVGS